jgi:voltage-gated potassium channel
MLVLSLTIIPLLVAPIAFDLSPGAETTIFALDWILWAAFALEYGIRLYLAPAKMPFIRSNVIDLLVVLVPFLRPLRVARSARALRLLRLSRVGIVGLRAIGAVRDVLTRHKLGHAALIAVVVVFASAGLVLELERSVPEPSITTYPSALWWAVSTVTTVGYGDVYPQSAPGRGVAVVLMLVGVGLFGLLAASLASFFVERDQERNEPATAHDVREVLKRLDRIERRLNEPRNQ